MKPFTFLLFLFFASTVVSQDIYHKRIKNSIDSTQINNLVLIQKFKINVPLDEVWKTYTTKKGWEDVFVAIAEVDFKINGTIKTSYDKNAKIGDSSTIILHVKNYVPNKLITLQAELSPHFPEFMKKDAKDLYNIIYFEDLDTKTTQLTSYGIGYKNNEKYKKLLNFFIKGNTTSYANLIKYLETGIPIQQ